MIPRYRIFISYSRQHADVGTDFYKLLLAGQPTFLDSLCINPGDEWREQIKLAISRCTHMYVLWCYHAQQSDYVAEEIELAVFARKRIVPIQIGNYPLSDELSRYQGVTKSLIKICSISDDNSSLSLSDVAHEAGCQLDNEWRKDVARVRRNRAAALGLVLCSVLILPLVFTNQRVDEARIPADEVTPTSRPTPFNEDIVRERWEKAAAQGDAQAMVVLGGLYADGRDVAQDYGKAFEWWEKAAEQGDATARSNLGWLYANGRGVAQDYGKAREWWEKAAEQGNARATFSLGWLYANGHGVAQDYGKAREWWEKATEMRRAEINVIEADETDRDGKPGEKTAVALGSYSFNSLFARQYVEALAAAERALALAPDQVWITVNRAHALMFLGRADETRSIYREHKGERSGLEGKVWDQAILDDFAEFEKAGLTHPQMAELRAFLASAEPRYQSSPP